MTWTSWQITTMCCVFMACVTALGCALALGPLHPVNLQAVRDAMTPAPVQNGRAPARQTLLVALAERPGSTTGQLAEATGLSQDRVYRVLTAAANSGEVIRDRDAPGAPWKWEIPGL